MLDECQSPTEGGDKPPQRFQHDAKLERKVTDALLTVGEEGSCEAFIELITWEQYEDMAGWDVMAPNVKYNLPPRRRKYPGSTQDDAAASSVTAHPTKNEWRHMGTGRNKRCYELDFVDSPAWRICIEPSTYKYIPNNGRYRASKLIKKLEIQKCVRKTCNEKLTPEQRQLQKEIQRELRREFEIYLRMEKQRQTAANVEKRKRALKLNFSNEDSDSDEDETIADSDSEDTSTPVGSEAISTCHSREKTSSPPDSAISSTALGNDTNQSAKTSVELPPIHVPLSSVNMQRYKSHSSAAHSNMSTETNLMVAGQTVESDTDASSLVPKTKRSMSEPPPGRQVPYRYHHKDQLCASEPQSHRQGNDIPDSATKLGYTQSMCDISTTRHPGHSIPSKVQVLTKDMIQVKPISSISAAHGGKERPERADGSTWSSPAFAGPGHSRDDLTATGTHTGINSAPAYHSRAKAEQEAAQKGGGGLEMEISATKISAKKTSALYRSALAAGKKSGKVKVRPRLSHGLKPPHEADVSDVVPAVVPVPHAFHSVPINKVRPRSKKPHPPSPPGLLPEISGQRIPVSLTSQKFL